MKQFLKKLDKLFDKDIVRRITILLVSLLLGAGVVFGVFAAYKYHEEEIKFDDLTTQYAYINSKGEFIAKFGTEKEHRSLSSITYEIEGDVLYITVFQTAGTERAVKADSNGLAEFTIPDCKGIKSVYYVANGEEDKIKLSK